MRVKVAVDEQETMVEGLSTSYLVTGEGTPLLLLHALEESAFDWRSMRERAETLGGSVRVDSRPGAGTRVELRVPLDGRS